jgi:hypothetical protein
MSWARMRLRDELRGLPLWALVTVVNLGVVLGLDLAVALGRGVPVPGWALVLTGWIGIGAYMLVGGRRERCRTFDLTLPLPAPGMWWVHLLSRVIAIGILAAIAAALIAFVSSRAAERVAWDLHPLVLLADLVAGGTLAAALLELRSPALQRPSSGRRGALWAAAVVLTIPVVLVLLVETGAAGAAGLLLAAAALVWVIHRAVPPAFVVEPDAALEDDGVSASRAAAMEAVAHDSSPAPNQSRRLAWRTLFGCLSGGRKDFFLMPTLVLTASVLAGLLTVWIGDPDLENLRVTYIPLASYMLFAAILTRLGQLHALDPLPFSRAKMFAVLMLPLVALLGLGFGATVVGIGRFGTHYELVDYRSWSDRVPPRVIVPAGFLEVAPAGAVPDIRAPWGETQTPHASPLFYGSHHVLYSPFDAPAGSSKRFVALQISRAAKAIYGVSIPPDEIATKDLEDSSDGQVLPRGGGLQLRAERDDLRPRTPSSYLAILLFAVVVSWLLVVALFFRTYRAAIQPRVRQLMVAAYIILFVVGMLGMSALMVKRIVHPAAANAALAIAGRHLDASALSAVGVWIVGVALSVAAYALAQHQFQQMEIPSRPTQYSLLDRMAYET